MTCSSSNGAEADCSSSPPSSLSRPSLPRRRNLIIRFPQPGVMLVLILATVFTLIFAPVNAQFVRFDPGFLATPDGSQLVGLPQQPAVIATDVISRQLPAAGAAWFGSPPTTPAPANGRQKFFDPDQRDAYNDKYGYRRKSASQVRLSSADLLKLQLKEQENRLDEFHFGQSFDPQKEDMLSRLGIVLSSSDCKLSPSPVISPDAHYFVIECPASVSKVTAQFLSGPPFREALTRRGRFLQKRISFNLAANGDVSTEYIQACQDPKVTESCYEVQIDAKRLSPNMPIANKLFIGKSAGNVEVPFNPKATDHIFQVYENEPLEVAVEGSEYVFTDVEGLRPERGFVQQTTHLVFRPRGTIDSRTLFLTDKDHNLVNSLLVEAHTTPSRNPKLHDLRSSIGRLDPTFSPSQYSYFLRVSESATHTKLRFTAMDDKNTICSYVDSTGKVRQVKGAGSTDSLTLGDPALTLTIDCVHPNAPDQHVRYIMQVVRQLGGSTLLRQLDLVGAGLQQPFVPVNKGPYTVNMANEEDLAWASFIALPQNQKASVFVEGFRCDPTTGHSPYFRIGLGVTRQFRIAVRTRENPVAEEYEVVVSRPAAGLVGATTASKLADWLGYTSTIISSPRAYTFLHNAKFLQWLSVSHRINGLPEAYDIWSRVFNKWNMQWEIGSTRLFHLAGSTSSVDRTPTFIASSLFNGASNLTSPDSFVAPPEDYGFVVSKYQLDPSYPLVLEWDNPKRQWVPTSIANLEPVKQALLHLKVQQEDNSLLENDSSGSLNSEQELIDNIEYFACALGDDCSEIHNELTQGAMESSKRRLAAISTQDRLALINKLELHHKNTQKVLDFTASFTTTTFLLFLIGIIYVAAWVLWLRDPQDPLAIRQDFPHILYPASFWLFILDYALISYCQACCGLVFSPLQNVDIYILGIVVTPTQLAVVCATMMVAFPLLFIIMGCTLLALNQGTIVFSKILQRNADPRIAATKAFWRPMPWLPVFGRLFDIEISHFLREPLKDVDGSPLPPFLPETRTNAPWNEPDNQRVFSMFSPPHKVVETQPLLSSNTTLPAGIKYYKFLDAIRAAPSEYLGVNSNYRVSTLFPDALVAFRKQPLLNAYGESVEVYSRLLLKHWAHLFAATAPVVLVPREHLDLVYADAMSNLVAKAQMGNFFYWALDRASLLMLILFMSMWEDVSGQKTLLMFGAVSLGLLLLYLPGVLQTSLSAWYRQMEVDFRLEEKMVKYDRENEDKFSVWPFKDPRARDHHERLRETKNIHRVGHPLYGIYASTAEQIVSLLHHNFWKTRTAMALRAFLTGPAFTEALKFEICLLVLLGSRSVGYLSNGFASVWGFALSAVALLFLNAEAISLLLKQIQVSLYESFIFGRRCAIALVDLSREPAFGIDRLGWYANQLSKVFTESDGGMVSFLYPGFQAESVRDFNCHEVAVISNEVGTHMLGDLGISDATRRQMFAENDPLSMPRHGVQKTLFVSGTIAVFRPELDRAMPVALPIDDYCAATYKDDRRVAATVQIVNHNTLRYIPRIRHDWRDDSFLTIFTDSLLVPPAGRIRKGHVGHGYVIKVDKLDQVLRIRGPNIMAGKIYHIKLTHNPPPKDERYEYDESSMGSSKHFPGFGEASVICRDPGRLVVQVPPGQTPDLQEEMTLYPPGGHEETIDPSKYKVVWDLNSRTMIVRTQHALLAGDLAYKLVWPIKPPGGVIQATTGTEISVRGEIVLNTRPVDADGRGKVDEVCDIDSAAWCVVRDAEKTVTIDINPRLTNAYEFLLSGIELPGSSGWLTQKSGQLLGEIDTILGKADIREAPIERIKCTLVQCVDPVAQRWRVEPDFDDAVFSLSARMQELAALHTQLSRQYDVLSDLWFRIISPSEFVNFWASRGLQVVDEHGRFVDPLRSDPRSRRHLAADNSAISAFQNFLSQRINALHQRLTTLQTEYKIWASGYRNIYLYEAQANLDSLQQDAEASLDEIAQAVENVRQHKRQYERALPGFVYPMIVPEKMISRASNWEIQFLQWEQLISAWLRQEEGASEDQRSHGHLSCYEFTLHEIMRALRFSTQKPENLLRGRSQTALHYVTSSRSVRGMDVNWKPDPLGATLSMVRLWSVDERGHPSPHMKQWEICFLKLTGTGIRIMMPSKDDKNPNALPWNDVCGWFIPLKCFEEILCLEDRSPIPEEETRYDFGYTMTGKLVFRRNTEGNVDDDYVMRCYDREFDNNFIKGSHLSERKIMLGFTSSAADDHQEMFPRELWYEQQHAGNKLYTFPLTFRMWPSDLERWDSVIKSCQMNRPPRDNSYFDGRVPREVLSADSSPIPIQPPALMPQISLDSGIDDDHLSSHDKSDGFGIEASDDTDTVELEAENLESEGTPQKPPSPRLPVFPSPPSSPTVSERIPTPRDPPLRPGELMDQFQDWRYHGPGSVRGSNPRKSAYDGDWHEGQRNGSGEALFEDPSGHVWKYKGGFAFDEPFGQSQLSLADESELDQLRRARDPALKHRIVAFTGAFVVPKNLTRGDTLPTAAQPALDSQRIQEFFARQGAGRNDIRMQDEATRVSPSDRTRNSRATGDNKLAPMNPVPRTLVVDKRRSLSACGHEGLMGVAMRNLDANYHEEKAFLIRDENNEDEIPGPLKDGQVGRNEYLPQWGRWARILEPNLGCHDMGRRMAVGEVHFADGTRFAKADARGLIDNKPDGKGHYYCPVCPLNYYGDFRKGRPEGYGCLEFGRDKDKVTYWGEFKDGKRSGPGTMVACNDKLYVEGHFEDDKLSGGTATIDVHKDLMGDFNFQWFQGEFKDGLPNGVGAINFFMKQNNQVRSGITYRGEFKDGLRNGKGCVYDADDKLILKSQWLNDQASGKADAYHLNSGMLYVGLMKGDERSGLGKLFESVAGGLIYDGMWDKDLPHGRGTLYAPDGQYEGQFEFGRRHGKGTFVFTDSASASERRTYEGSWKDDRPHGVGTYRADNDQLYTVEFVNGKVSPKSIKAHRNGPCGSTPTFPNPHVQDVPAIGSRHRDDFDKGTKLRPELFQRIQNIGGEHWPKHEIHPYAYRMVEGDMPPQPASRICSFERQPLPSKDDSLYVYRIVIRRARDLKKSGRKPRACVRVGLLHHDVSTKADDLNGCDPVWNQTLLLPFIRTHAIFFTVCDKAGNISSTDALRETDRPLGFGIWQLGEWLKTGQNVVDVEIPLEIMDRKTGNQQVGFLEFSIEKLRATPDMEVHRDDYDPAALRQFTGMPTGMKDQLFSAPDQYQ